MRAFHYYASAAMFIFYVAFPTSLYFVFERFLRYESAMSLYDVLSASGTMPRGAKECAFAKDVVR